jgi:hypothetical protein
VFHPVAEGQIRGVPWVAPAMVRLWLLDQYDDAELDRKKVAAMFAGFVTRPGPDDVMGEDSAQKDQEGAALIGLQPGTMQLLLPGEDIKFSDPADVGGSYEAASSKTMAASWVTLAMPCAATMPNSARWPRKAFTSIVRCRTRRSRVRCTIRTDCASALLTGTKRMVGRVTASQMASASAASFFPRLT